MINFVIISSDFMPYVLATWAKTGVALSPDYHLVVSYTRWIGLLYANT